MLDKALARARRRQARGRLGEIDKRVMEDAVIYPGVCAKSLLVRGEALTNVFVNDAYGMYDYVALGLE